MNSFFLLLLLTAVLIPAAVSADDIVDDVADISVNQDSTIILSGDNDAADDTVDASVDQDSTIILSNDSNIADDTVDTSLNQDTATVSTPKTDDSAIQKNVTADIKPDTVATPKMSGTYFGFGVSLSVGSAPIFELWRNALPLTMDSLGIDMFFGRDLVPGDTLLLRYRVLETPDKFNFSVPFSISLHKINDGRAYAFALSLFHSSKQFQSSFFLGHNMQERRLDIHETLRFYSLAIEAACMFEIPPLYFSVNGAERTYITMALGLSPINTLTRSSGVKVANAEGEDLRLRALADSVKKQLPKLSSNGMSLSWRLGATTTKSYGQGGGIEFGFYYGGSYTTLFYADGEQLTRGQINPADENADKPLSFMSTRAEFKATFLKSPNRDKQISQ